MLWTIAVSFATASCRLRNWDRWVEARTETSPAGKRSRIRRRCDSVSTAEESASQLSSTRVSEVFTC